MYNPFHKILQIYNAGFRQSTDATCGPTSMALATMGLGLELKQESEWINSSFSQWMPVDQFLERGMALHELQFISQLIYGQEIDIVMRRSYPENLPLFLNDIQNSFQTMRSVIIVNYQQDDFIYTAPHPSGNPHYSPIVDWNQSQNEIWIADVDPAIKVPYWVKIESIFQSMSNCNPAINLPRGWLVLYKRTPNSQSSALSQNQSCTGQYVME